MYIDYKNAIQTLINSHLSSIKTVDWYNAQYNRYEDLKAVVLPAVYIEFERPVRWRTAGDGLQTSETVIKLHLVVKDLKDSPEPTLASGGELHKLMHGQVLMNEDTQLSTALVRTESELKTEYDQLKILILSYETTLFDCSTMPVRKPIAVSLGVVGSD